MRDDGWDLAGFRGELNAHNNGRKIKSAWAAKPRTWPACAIRPAPKARCPLAILAVVRMTLGTFAWLVRQSILSTLDDGCFGFAKAAAYSALLSFFFKEICLALLGSSDF